jgi:hypothetical protein
MPLVDRTCCEQDANTEAHRPSSSGFGFVCVRGVGGRNSISIFLLKMILVDVCGNPAIFEVLHLRSSAGLDLVHRVADKNLSF